MPATDLILIPGWAHPAEALHGLAAELNADFAVSVVGPAELGSESPAGALGRRLRSGRPVLLVGWSLGAVIALEAAALARPGAVAGVCAIAAVSRLLPNADERFGRSAFDAGTLLDRLAREPASVLAEFMRAAAQPFDLAEAELRDKVAAGLALGTSTLIAGMRHFRSADLQASLPAIEAPALVLHGREDAVLPWRSGRLLARGLPNARWQLEPRSGHDLPVRDPQLVAQAIRARFALD